MPGSKTGLSGPHYLPPPPFFLCFSPFLSTPQILPARTPDEYLSIPLPCPFKLPISDSCECLSLSDTTIVSCSFDEARRVEMAEAGFWRW